MPVCGVGTVYNNYADTKQCIDSREDLWFDYEPDCDVVFLDPHSDEYFCEGPYPTYTIRYTYRKQAQLTANAAVEYVAEALVSLKNKLSD